MIKIRVRYLIATTLITSFLSGGCTQSLQLEPEEPPQNIVYTQAAQTVVTHYTQTALEFPTGTAVPTETPPEKPEPTWTSEPSPTPTPSETPTSTIIPDTIFEDDFSNTSLWYTAEENNFGFEYKDGGYRIYNKILNGAIWSVRFLTYQDIRIEVDATRIDGPKDGYFGVICRMGNDGNDYYALVIGDDGFYGILKMEGGEQEFLDSGYDEKNIIQLGLGEVNRVRGICSGDRLQLVVNEQLLLEINDDTFTSGDVGIVAGNRLTDVGIDVVFDNFALVKP